jgi:hypothetical protein
MNKTYIKGDDFLEKGVAYHTFGITEQSKEKNIEDHTNKIEVYGDSKLRDKIIKLLNRKKA